MSFKWHKKETLEYKQNINQAEFCLTGSHLPNISVSDPSITICIVSFAHSLICYG